MVTPSLTSITTLWFVAGSPAAHPVLLLTATRGIPKSTGTRTVSSAPSLPMPHAAAFGHSGWDLIF